MKTKVAIYGELTPVVPTELRGFRQFVSMDITGYMKMYGVEKLAVTIQNVGIASVPSVSFKPFPITPPDGLLRSRPAVLRRLGEIMHIFGIMQIELTATPVELHELETGWSDAIIRGEESEGMGPTTDTDQRSEPRGPEDDD